jgi:hypothetical protein
MTNLDLARIQFAFTSIDHSLFVPDDHTPTQIIAIPHRTSCPCWPPTTGTGRWSA